jgi:hypothetical protein
VSNVGFIVAGVGAGLAIIGFVVGGKAEVKTGGAPSVNVEPYFAGQQAGLRGSF